MDAHFSKSHVLAGVQDAYWSDEEGENDECPLCLEELDISDMGFKPCGCGYQICRFCWHHIKENLNGKCPACRRAYTEDGVEFKPVNPDDIKRLNQQKKNKERERKELEALNRRNLTNVRVVQRNVVYVTGIGPRFAREELIPTLRSNDYFGQYGKITKLLLVKRNNPSTGSPVVGLYITYYRQEDAKRAIAAVDGTASFSGHGEITRASYGTTKYCIAFLRGIGCGNKGCLDLHEWGNEADCFTKEDLTTLKHTMKDMEMNAKKNANDAPRRPAWSSRPSVQSASSKGLPPPSSSVPNRNGRTVLPSTRSTKALKPIDTITTARREKDRDREKNQTKKTENTILSVASSSSDRNVLSNSPANTISAPRALTPLEDSDHASSVAEAFSTNEQPSSRPTSRVPPPGLSLPSSSSEEISSYQPSTAAQALLDDVRSRRHQQRTDSVDASSYSHNSPFPDFDRTLQVLRIGSNDAHNDTGLKFSFDFDADDISADAPNPLNFNLPPAGTFNPMTRAPPPAPIGRYTSNFDPFASSSPGGVDSTQDSRLANPPGGYDARYRGSFDPFADVDTSSVPSQASPALSFAASYDGERTTSRFDFARRGTPTRTFPPLPSHLGNDGRRGSPLISSPIESQPASPHLFHGAATPPRQPSHTQTTILQVPQSQNTLPSIPPGLGHVTSQSISLSQLFGTNFSQPQLAPTGDPPPGWVDKGARNPMKYQNTGQHAARPPFTDPAIMSASFLAKGVTPPPGLANGPSPGIPIQPTPAAYTFIATNRDYGHFGSVLPTEVSNSKEGSKFVSDQPRRGSVSLSISQTEPSSAPSPFQPQSVLSEDASSVAPEPTQDLSPPTLLASEFPALPTSSALVGTSGSTASQPHISRTAPKVAETKTAPKVEKRKEVAVRKQRSESASRAVPQEKKDDKGMEIKDKLEEKKEEKKKLASKTTPKNTHTLKAAENAQSVVPNPARVPPKEKLEKPASEARKQPPSEPEPQAPLLSRQSRKEKKGKVKPVKVNRIKEEGTTLVGVTQPVETLQPQLSSEVEMVRPGKSVIHPARRSTVAEMLSIIDRQMQSCLDELFFFNQDAVTPKSQTPLQYGPLVHALSALSVGGGTFSNSLPSRSIDTAVSSFQSLLETLTQTISDLLRLLPRTTWDDSASFDGVLRDMLKGDDFFDEPTEEATAKEDEVTALTQALERRARWMEVQLSKLEELHRDINTAAVRAVLTLNDRGWDQARLLPRDGHSVQRFENLAFKHVKGVTQFLSIPEMEKKLERCQDLEHMAESDLRKCMANLNQLKNRALDDWYD